MTTSSDPIIERAREVFAIEARGLAEVAATIDHEFIRAVELMLTCTGKVVVTGMGKSGLIGRKIAATLASTGTPSFFLHPAEGLHGDLGMISAGDVVLGVSKSGNSEEVNVLLPIVKRFGVQLIGMAADSDSVLARFSDVYLSTKVAEEACPLGVAPTSSTTASLVMGDALAVALLEKRRFSHEDFARFHPGGALGKSLIYQVADLMHTAEQIPIVQPTDGLEVVILEMTGKRLGHALVCDQKQHLVGIITDGDMRRVMGQSFAHLEGLTAQDIMTTDPVTTTANLLAAVALRVMEEKSVTVLAVLDPESNCVGGVIHIHDILRAGIV